MLWNVNDVIIDINYYEKSKILFITTGSYEDCAFNDPTSYTSVNNVKFSLENFVKEYVTDNFIIIDTGYDLLVYSYSLMYIDFCGIFYRNSEKLINNVIFDKKYPHTFLISEGNFIRLFFQDDFSNFLKEIFYFEVKSPCNIYFSDYRTFFVNDKKYVMRIIKYEKYYFQKYKYFFIKMIGKDIYSEVLKYLIEN